MSTTRGEVSERDQGEADYRAASLRRESVRADYYKGRNVQKLSTMSDQEFAAALVMEEHWRREWDAAVAAQEAAWRRYGECLERLGPERRAREIDRLVAEQLRGAR